jgi:HEAT repeat protein
MRTKLLAAFVAVLALSAMLLAGGARAQRAARQGNENVSGGQAKSKRVVGVRSSDSGNGSRVTITADDTLKDYSSYRSGDRFYVVLPKAAAGARGGGAGRGYSDMQVQQRGDSVVLSYRVQPGAKPRVEQKFNRLDVVFDVPGDAGQQAEPNNDARRQPTPPAESRNPAAQQNRQAQAATSAPGAHPTPERRQPAAEETARAQAANSAAANTTPPVVAAERPGASVEPAAQNSASTSVEPAPEPATTPAAEPQVAQAQQPAPVAPITTSQPVSYSQPAASLGTFLIRNWALSLVFALAVVGLGLVIAARRVSAGAPAPVEGLDEEVPAKLEESRPARAKEATAKALKDASAAALASTVAAAKASTVTTAEPVGKVEPVSRAETVGAVEASGAGVEPLAAAAALAGGVAAAKSKKQSKKDARQEARRKKKGARVEVLAGAETPAVESAVAEPVAQEAVVEEDFVEAPPVEEPVVEEPAEVAQAATTEEVEDQFVSSAIETAEPEQFEVVAPTFDISEAESTGVEVAPVEAETAEFSVTEVEARAPATEIEPAFTPDPERVLAETHSLLEGEEYDRAVVGARDAMARQMIAAELLSALAGRNALKRERAGAAFVEHGYFDETARDLREADAPAERSAAARSLAILGDRNATPLLVAALGDPVSDVRRAAVEALGALRDPSAVEPLEALLERERTERNRIPPRVIRAAVEFCQEGFAQTPAAETQTAIPAVEAGTPAPTCEPAEVGEEPSVSDAPFVDEAEPLIAPEPAAEATGEPAHIPEPVHAEEAFETIAETGAEPLVGHERPFVGFEEAPAAADTSKELTPSAAEVAAGEWFDFDIGEGGGESRPAASATVTPEPETPEPVFETSSGEALAAPAGVEVEEAAPVNEASASVTRDIEVADVAAEASPDLQRPESAHATSEPAAEAREKGLAPFDELSTVPASIQQRIASGNANERAVAIVELSHVNTDEAFQQICAAFDDPSKEVRSAAARALHELHTDRAESFTRALREASPERRRQIGAAISASGLAAESLSQLTGESRERTYESFSLLFLMAKAGEVQPLLRAIEGHPNHEVRLAVVKLLALSEQKEVLLAFRRLKTQSSLPAEVRGAVADAIDLLSSHTLT